MPSTDQAILFASTYREMPDPHVTVAAILAFITVSILVYAVLDWAVNGGEA